jgi:hypothetical protein
MSSNTINNALAYARSFVGIPYRWHRANDPIASDDKFWASNEPLTITAAAIQRDGKSIVCTGLVNLVRRHLGLTVPGLDTPYPGTTGAWFSYLAAAGRLEPIDVKKHYPAGTLLLRDFGDIETDQGHVAILAEPPAREPITAGTLIHAYADVPYEQAAVSARPAGLTGFTPFSESHYYASEKGYYSHICRPENWILRD